MGMIGQTDFKVGPGTYKPETSLDRLKAKPCMAKIKPSVILREDCYEVVNNIKVLQPKYLKESERRMLIKQIKNFRNTHKNLLRKKIPAESFLFQKGLLLK